MAARHRLKKRCRSPPTSATAQAPGSCAPAARGTGSLERTSTVARTTVITTGVGMVMDMLGLSQPTSGPETQTYRIKDDSLFSQKRTSPALCTASDQTRRPSPGRVDRLAGSRSAASAHHRALDQVEPNRPLGAPVSAIGGRPASPTGRRRSRLLGAPPGRAHAGRRRPPPDRGRSLLATRR